MVRQAGGGLQDRAFVGSGYEKFYLDEDSETIILSHGQVDSDGNGSMKVNDYIDLSID